MTSAGTNALLSVLVRFSPNASLSVLVRLGLSVCRVGSTRGACLRLLHGQSVSQSVSQSNTIVLRSAAHEAVRRPQLYLLRVIQETLDHDKRQNSLISGHQLDRIL